MLYVSVAKNQRLAQYDFDEYIKSHESHIKKARRINGTVMLDNDDLVTFVSEKEYDIWCKGRTYKFLGDNDHLYRSGHVQLESIYGVQLMGVPFRDMRELTPNGKLKGE